MHASERSPQSFSATVELEAAGVTLGSDTRLVRFDARTGRLALAADRERCLALLAIAAPGARLDTTTIQHLVAAAAYWERGDKALANLRLVFAGLPRLRDAGDAARLRAAEYLLDHGMTPSELLHELEIDAAGLGLQKEYDPDQPRVPAGQGKDSGRWTDWLGHWLAEDVPVYDQDTGDEVGTRSRGSAIATNPLTIIGAGAAVLAGAELVPAAMEAWQSALFTARYLVGTGGRLGGTAVRRQLYNIAREYMRPGEFTEFSGDGAGDEEFIPGDVPGSTRGSTWVDFTAWRSDGSAVRVQTVDTLADGVTPTAAERAAAERIREKFPNDELILIPKTKK